MTATAMEPDEDFDDTEPGGSRRRLPALLVCVMVLAALILVGAGGFLLGKQHDSTPGTSSVDAGFAWDMSTHHRQAISMAAYTRDHTTDPAIKNLAYDIETEQEGQVGEMSGWLDSWGLPQTSPNAQMSWMSAAHMGSMSADSAQGSAMTAGVDPKTGLMPGMATQAQMTELLTSTGKKLDVLFLQLMLHHHQGGLAMAQYGTDHASQGYVRQFASKIVAAQSNEIITMEQMLRERGAAPLAPPTS